MKGHCDNFKELKIMMAEKNEKFALFSETHKKEAYKKYVKGCKAMGY